MEIRKCQNGLDLQISKAEKRDANQIIEYLNLVGGESDHLLFGANEFPISVEAEEQLIEQRSSSKTSALLVGKIDGEIVCVGSIVSSPRERIAHQAELALSVKKKYWGLGFGTCLLQSMIAFARENGQTEILHLGVKEDNIAARKLYETLGFVEIGIYKKFFKVNGRYYDEILMNLYL